MNNWRLLLFAVVAVLLPVGSFTERNLFDGSGQCCDHRSDYPEARLHGTYRKSTQENHRLSTRLLADRSDARDIRRHETRYGDPLRHSGSDQRVSIERRYTEPERSVRNQERQQRNFPASRLSGIASSRRDVTRNDRASLDSTRRNTLDDTSFERRTQDANLIRNFRTENERRMSIRTERNEIKKDAKPTEEFIQHELRLKNERVVLRLREDMRDSRHFRTSEERRELRRMASNAERRQSNQLRDSRESVERRDVRKVERVVRDELELKQINRAMQFNRPQQQRSDNRQSRDTEFTMIRESRRREVQKRLSRDPVDSGPLRMREIRSLERLERVQDSRDVRFAARSNERLERNSERSRISEERMPNLSESRFRTEPQRKDVRLEVGNRSIENRAVSRNSVRKDSELSKRFNVADRSERNYESERRLTNSRAQMESRVSEERRETHRMSPDDFTRVAQIIRARVGVQGESTRNIAREMRERSDIRNSRNSEMTRDRRTAYDRPDSRTEFRLSRERLSVERSRILETHSTLSSAENIRDSEREVTRERRSVDDRSNSRREFRLSKVRSSLERNREARNTLASARNIRDSDPKVTRDQRSVDDRSDSRGELRLSRERSSMERSRNLDARNTLSAVRNTRDIKREVTRDRRSVDARSDSRREFRLNRARSSLESSRNLEARNTLSSASNVRDSNPKVTRDQWSVEERSDSRGELRLSRERSSVERNINLDARNTLFAVRNTRDIEREVTRDRRSVDARSDSRREFGLNRERSSLESSRILEARNTLSSARNVRDSNPKVTRDQRSVEERSDSRGELRLSRERSSVERNINLDTRNTLSAVRNTRDIQREVTRDRRSVDDRSDSRKELRLSRAKSSLERSRNLDARSTLSTVRNVRDSQPKVTRDQISADRIDSRRERTTLDRSRSLEARFKRETQNRAVRNERQTQRERSVTIRPQIDRLAIERNVRTTESRNGIQADLFRVRENMINEKTENRDSANWQYMFYTLQGAYLCALLVQMMMENPMKSKTRNFSWWLPASNNLIKVE